MGIKKNQNLKLITFDHLLIAHQNQPLIIMIREIQLFIANTLYFIFFINVKVFL